MQTMVRLTIVAAGIVLVGAVGRADEEKVPVNQLPKAVVDAVKKRFPALEVNSASKELTDDKKTVYEVTLKDGKKNIDVTLTPAGVIVVIEKEIDHKHLPKVVADAVAAKYPDAVYKLCEEIIPVKDGRETLESYEVLLETKDRKKIEVVVSPAGKISKTEEKKGEQ